MAKRQKKQPKSRSRSAKPRQPKRAKPDSSHALRQQLAKCLETSEAHASWRDAFAEMPPELRGAKFVGSPHTAWQLLEHLRLAQWDILEFSRDAEARLPGFSPGLLAADSRSSRRCRLGQKRARLPPRCRRNAQTHPRSANGSLRENPARLRPNNLPRSPADHRSQRLSSRPASPSAPLTGRLANSVAPALALNVAPSLSGRHLRGLDLKL